MKSKNDPSASESNAKRPKQIIRWTKLLALQILVVLVAVIGTDWLLVKLNLLRPPFRYGEPDVGFVTQKIVRMSKDYGRTTDFPESKGLVIAVVGDSHSALYLKEPLKSHEFVLEASLRDAGLPVVMLSAGQGKYSPLQEYLLYKSRLRDRFSPRIVMMNIYTGNDFNDMLRPDDRPHYAFVNHGTSIAVEPPIWFRYKNPKGSGTWREQSRFVWAFDESLDRLGYPKILLRIWLLTTTARKLDRGFSDVLSYLYDIHNSVEPGLGEPGAFAAQILNQAIFYRHFPEGKQKSLMFLDHLMKTAKRENPEVLFVLSPIPSAALADAIPPDIRPLWKHALDKVGLTSESVRHLEDELYEQLRRLAQQNGWLFVDTLPVFLENAGKQPLYNNYDLHVDQAACQLIGHEQARVLLEHQHDWTQ